MWLAGNTWKSAGRYDRFAEAWQGRRGFSHPARFETLEPRLPLAAVAGSSDFTNIWQFGAGSVGNEIGQGYGPFSVPGLPMPGAASPTNGPNPADPSLVDVRADATPTTVTPPYDGLAFNNPSWIPDDRPFNTAQNNGFPLNTYQAANTPFGIRNFNIGANTSVAHSPGPRIGANPATARREAAVRVSMSESSEQILGEDMLADIAKWPGKAKLPEIKDRFPEEDDVAAQADRTAADEQSNSVVLATSDLCASDALRLDSAAVDQMMASGQRPETATVDSIAAEVAPSIARSSQQPVPSALHGAAASLAIAATGAAPPSDVSSQAALVLWRWQ